MALSKIFSTSNVTTSVNIPEEFGVLQLSTTTNTLNYKKNFNIKEDINGVNTIIEFDRIPYIDFSKYDHQRRTWFFSDKYGSLWRSYHKNDYIIELDEIFEEQWSDFRLGLVFSIENILKNIFPEGIHTNDGNQWQYIVDFNLTEYKPITIKLQDEEFEDITDYSFNVQPSLDFISPNKNKQFYFDKNNRLYTNIDLFAFNIDEEPQNLEITYYTNVTDISVSCQMNTNNSKYSNYTPVVDYYILKLTGQTV